LKRKILIIDDEPDLLTYLKTFLEDQGFEVACAPDVPSALEMIDEDPPDLICLDLMMPIQSGVSLFQHLGRDESRRGIPVIIISGMNEEAMSNLAEGIGGIGGISERLRFLNKPVNLNQLLRAIHEALP
jgi:CheY-like chemotaxis protein